jgi:UDP-glucose 4-epimerase
MASVLVTGTAGFIGSHTVELLLKEGHRVIGLDDFSYGSLQNIATFAAYRNWSFYECDMVTNGTLNEIVRKSAPNVIIHLAGLVNVQRSIEEPDLNYRLNVHASYLLAEAARRNEVQRLVFASSAAVYGDKSPPPINEAAIARPISPYGAAKLASESLFLGHARTYGIVVRCQRYFNVYGSRQVLSSPYSGVISRFVNGFATNSGVTVYGTGTQTRDFIAVEDVARANLLAAVVPELRSGAANICTGRPVSLNKLIETLCNFYPKGTEQRFFPARSGDILHSFGDTALASSEMGFSASISLEQGIGVLVDATSAARGSTA